MSCCSCGDAIQHAYGIDPSSDIPRRSGIETIPLMVSQSWDTFPTRLRHRRNLEKASLSNSAFRGSVRIASRVMEPGSGTARAPSALVRQHGESYLHVTSCDQDTMQPFRRRNARNCQCQCVGLDRERKSALMSRLSASCQPYQTFKPYTWTEMAESLHVTGLGYTRKRLPLSDSEHGR